MNTKRTHTVILQLMRLRQLKALESSSGSWKDKDHPELKQGAAKWVNKLRRQDEKRFQKITRHRQS